MHRKQQMNTTTQIFLHQAPRAEGHYILALTSGIKFLDICWTWSFIHLLCWWPKTLKKRSFDTCVHLYCYPHNRQRLRTSTYISHVSSAVASFLPYTVDAILIHSAPTFWTFGKLHVAPADNPPNNTKVPTESPTPGPNPRNFSNMHSFNNASSEQMQ